MSNPNVKFCPVCTGDLEIFYPMVNDGIPDAYQCTACNETFIIKEDKGDA